MRIVVFSDSHGCVHTVRKILMHEKGAAHVIFCGDGIRDIEHIADEFSDKIFHIVKGNCDYQTDYPESKLITIKNFKIFIAHGHTYSVKSTENEIITAAKVAHSDVLVYGHTHKSKIEYISGMYIVCPGSCSKDGCTYAVIDIAGKDILPSIIQIDKI